MRVTNYLSILRRISIELGFNPLGFFNSIRGIPIYIKQLLLFVIANRKHKNGISVSVLSPCLSDRYSTAAKFDQHYFFQDLWAAKKVYQNNPKHHVDVGSRIDGFISHLLIFRNVEVLDVRPMTSNVMGMSFRQVDLMQFDKVPEGMCDSVSCLHALEHFGLGRYGDPIDPEGYIKGLKSLEKMLMPNGKLLLSVPIGYERVEFNAHRVFSIETILQLTQESFQLLSFSVIDDEGNFHENSSLKLDFHIEYGCGLFELVKK
jgi:hypothetical protein